MEEYDGHIQQKLLMNKYGNIGMYLFHERLVLILMKYFREWTEIIFFSHFVCVSLPALSNVDGLTLSKTHLIFHYPQCLKRYITF